MIERNSCGQDNFFFSGSRSDSVMGHEVSMHLHNVVTILSLCCDATTGRRAEEGCTVTTSQQGDFIFNCFPQNFVAFLSNTYKKGNITIE